MRRVLSVYLPMFSTDLARRRSARETLDGPGDRARRRHEMVVLTRPVASRELVSRRCELAAMAGVAEGMDLAHARTLLPNGVVLRVEPHRPDRDAAALHALACWAVRFSPLVAPDPPDGLLIDITGTERVHGGEARLIRSVGGKIRRLGFSVRVAAAATFGCAWGVARFGTHALSRTPSGREREAISGLPLAALRLDEATILTLNEIGIACVGDLLALPRSSLASRFGEATVRRVHQALGSGAERIEPVRPAPPLRCGLIFDGPTDHWESIETAVRRTVEEMTTHLARRERGVRQLDLHLLRPRAAPTIIQLTLSRPSRALPHLWSLTRSRLERIDLTDGVEGVSLTATQTARLRHQQSGSSALGAGEDHVAETAWGELIDTLVSRLGADGVLRMEPVESHLPEQAFRERFAMEPLPRAPIASVTPNDRPTILFPRPEPAEAMALTPDGPLVCLGWRGRSWKVLRCCGPERIGQEWWRWEPPESPDGIATPCARRGGARRGVPPDRDYFSVQTENGRLLWIFRHVETSRWFVHGEWS